MLKNFSLMKRKEGMSLDEFRKWALEEHVELGKNIPGILHYRMNVVLEENPTTPDGISEMWFDSMDARNAALRDGRGEGGRRGCRGALLFSHPRVRGREDCHPVTGNRFEG